MKIDYERVSTCGQSLELQINSLEKVGCEKVFSEKISGAKTQREEFEVMLDFVREGDQVAVTKLDRLSRSSMELQKTPEILENKKVDLMVLEQKIDTSTPSRRFLFNMIGVVAEFEREMINERASEGRKAARERGIVFGRNKKVSKEDLINIKNLLAMGESKANIIKMYGIGRTTLYRLLNENRKASCIEGKDA